MAAVAPVVMGVDASENNIVEYEKTMDTMKKQEKEMVCGGMGWKVIWNKYL